MTGWLTYHGIGGAESCPEISRSKLPRAVSFMRRSASSANSLSSSAPTKKRSSSLAATPVVPDPVNGSKTRSPSQVEASSALRKRRKGFWVGWYPCSFSLLGTVCIRQTEDTWAPGSNPFMRS